MSSTAKTLASMLQRLTVALVLLILTSHGLSRVAWGQVPRTGPASYPTNGHGEAPGAPQRFAPETGATRPLVQPPAGPPVDGQRATYTTPETQPRANLGAAAPPPKSRPPILLSPRGQGTGSRGAKTEDENGEQPRRTSSPKPNLLAIFGSLGIVLGLFFAVVWVMRRGMPTAAKPLPADVVEVLGRTPLAGRQQAHLIRCGNKMLLVSLTADSATTLTEITDPLEVDRIAGLCHEAHPHSNSQAFRQIFHQFATEKTPGGWFSRLTGAKRSKSVDDEVNVEDLNV